MRVRGLLTTTALVLALAACGQGDAPTAPPDTAAATSTTTAAAVELPDLRAELLTMQRDDQAERTGEGVPAGVELPPVRDYTRTQRLKAIIAEHGWPGRRLVGEDGDTAAWVVVQHADFDVAFQQQVVELMGAAVRDGQASPGNLAYLQDRVAVNTGAPQPHGTQVRCRDGVPAPATPLRDPGGVDALRASAGLAPLAEYYQELAMMCADEAAEGIEPPS